MIIAKRQNRWSILGGAVSNFVDTALVSINLQTSAKIVAILAGGKATRFVGQDKGEIIIKGERLIDMIYTRLQSQASDILISGQNDYGLGFELVPDVKTAPAGPVGGIYSIWDSLQGREIDGFYTVACDGPNLPRDLIDRLYSKDSSTIALDAQGRHPTYGWWRMKDLALIWAKLNRTQSMSLNRLADIIEAKEIVWPGDEFFLNINSQSDLDDFIKRLVK